MNDYCFVCDLTDISENECFREASASELRVLLVLIEYNRRRISLDTLCELAGTSAARTKSAIALFEAAGVLAEADSFAIVKDEFSEQEIERRAINVAREIRDEGLAELITECTALMEKESLSTEDVKIITNLVTDTTLSPEYILTLLAFLSSTVGENKKITAKKLRAEAEKLLSKDIDTLEALEAYVKNKTEELHYEWEYRRALQMWSRGFSSAEREYIKKWAHVYGFSTAIVTEAYERTVLATSGISFPYMDALLTDWHSSGCTTLAECKARSEQTSAEFKAKKTARAGTKKTQEAATPNFSNFDSDDAMMRALERSYGKSGY